MNEGASLCAGGVKGACDVTYFPDYLWPGVIFIIITISIILLLRKKLSKNIYKIALMIWLALVICFTVVVFVNAETAGERTGKALENCKKQAELHNPQAGLCEY
jgi:Mn2+/Fe2+ NRAMP family transporter